MIKLTFKPVFSKLKVIRYSANRETGLRNFFCKFTREQHKSAVVWARSRTLISSIRFSPPNQKPSFSWRLYSDTVYQWIISILTAKRSNLKSGAPSLLPHQKPDFITFPVNLPRKSLSVDNFHLTGKIRSNGRMPGALLRFLAWDRKASVSYIWVESTDD